jgi:trimeric autotransporter adhesin
MNRSAVSSTVALLGLACVAAVAAQAPHWTQTAIVKPAPAHEGENFGAAVAVSADGATMAVGAPHDAGAVYVFARDGAAWKQQGALKASNADDLDAFGSALAISADGNTLIVGAYFEDGGGKGVNANADNSIPQSGAAYVFVRRGTAWTQQAYLKASNPGDTEDGDTFGYSVTISGDGNTVAVGAPSEDSDASGVNGDQSNNNAVGSGAVYLFERTGATWAQTVYLKSDAPAAIKGGDLFGYSVALNANGTALAVGSYDEGSAAGINGPFDNKLGGSGAAFVYRRSGTTWTRDAFLKAKEQDRNDSMGNAIAISDDGNTVAVGALDEDTLESGINAVKAGHTGETDVPDDNSSGAVYVFVRGTSGWSQQASFKASNAGKNDQFGIKLALSGDGNTMAVGATAEDSNAKGLNGNQADNSANEAGAVYTFSRTGTTWAQTAYVKGSNTEEFDEFGSAVALTRNGGLMAIGAKYEDSAAAGNPADNMLLDAGAVYVFTAR